MTAAGIALISFWLFSQGIVRSSVSYASGSSTSADVQRWKTGAIRAAVAMAGLAVFAWVISIFAGTTGRESDITNARKFLFIDSGMLWFLGSLISPSVMGHLLHQLNAGTPNRRILQFFTRIIMVLSPLPLAMVGAVILWSAIGQWA